jgi:hypothetical protein
MSLGCKASLVFHIWCQKNHKGNAFPPRCLKAVLNYLTIASHNHLSDLKQPKKKLKNTYFTWLFSINWTMNHCHPSWCLCVLRAFVCCLLEQGRSLDPSSQGSRGGGAERVIAGGLPRRPMCRLPVCQGHLRLGLDGGLKTFGKSKRVAKCWIAPPCRQVKTKQ